MDMQKPKYIRNKELLAEIHASKKTYCYFERPEYADYDVIVTSLEDITPEVIEKAIHKRKNPKGKPPLDIDITAHDLVFRMMTHEHIPLDPDRKRKARNTDKSYARTNFPPFKHFVLRNGVYVEVGRSHWRGDLETGTFALDKGRVTNMLALMLMKLVERYARRGNWRGYCVDTETEALTQRGWVYGDDLNEADKILSLSEGRLTWSSIKSIYRNHYEGNMFRLTARGIDALVTPGHKFLTQHGLKPVEMLLESDNIILSGEPLSDQSTETHEDAFVELVGWTACEGSFHFDAARRYPRVSIYQNEGEYADRIRACGEALGSPVTEHKRDEKGICFHLKKDLCLRLAEVLEIDGKALTIPFILALTQRQRRLLIETMIDADGHRNFKSKKPLLRYVQKSKDHTDAFVMLCTLSGLRTSVKERQVVSFGKPTTVHQVTIFSDRAKHSRVENVDFHGGKRNGTVKGRGKALHPNEPTIPYNGAVWCPETEFGTFVARRNGYVYLTGNSYNDEMQGFALQQLSAVCLYFDESKGDNPFAFYWTTITNCFTRVLLVEKRNQKIRDDMLTMAGVSPSYTRQIENELEAKKTATPGDAAAAAPARKRGAPRRKVTIAEDI